MTLRQQLIGTWMLTSFEQRPTDGSQTTYPLGETPQGIIMYTADGYMSAQLMQSNRPNHPSGDWRSGPSDEVAAQGSGYLAYSGPFDVDEEKRHLTHTMSVSLFPNWVGQVQPRAVEIDGDVLTLSTTSPLASGGQEVNAYVIWKRALSRS